MISPSDSSLDKKKPWYSLVNSLFLSPKNHPYLFIWAPLLISLTITILVLTFPTLALSTLLEAVGLNLSKLVLTGELSSKDYLEHEYKALTGIFGIAAGLIAVLSLIRSYVTHTLERDKEQNQRFKDATELLASTSVDVRLGAIYSLEALIQESPDRFGFKVIELLSAYLRHKGLILNQWYYDKINNYYEDINLLENEWRIQEENIEHSNATKLEEVNLKNHNIDYLSEITRIEECIEDLKLLPATHLQYAPENLPTNYPYIDLEAAARVIGGNRKTYGLTKRLNLRNMFWHGLTLENCDFSNTDFDNSSCMNTSFKHTIFEDVSFSEAVFSRILANYCVFKRCDFSESDFSHSDLCNSDFSGSNFQGADFSQVEIFGANLDNTNFVFDEEVTTVKSK